MAQSLKQEAWSRYWQAGFLTTFTAEESENYVGAIKKFWWSEFNLLPEGATIVDIGSGNGAILALAQEFMDISKRPLNLIAVDFADISKSDFFLKNKHIQVLNETSIESTGLETGSVDLCLSQYGFEYSDTEKASVEISRILKTGGRFSALLHHSESEVSIASKVSIEQIALCETSGLVNIIELLLRRLNQLQEESKDPSADAQADELRSQFNQKAGELLSYGKSQSNSAHINYFLTELSGVFSKGAKALSFQEKLDIVKNVDVDSRLYKLRMEAMLAAAHDLTAINALKERFKSLQFNIYNVAELRGGRQVMAWALNATKMK